MKFLLTSNGFSSQSIADALIDLVGKRPEETNIAFIPTAANVDKGDKGWLIDDLSNIKKQNFRTIDIVDISALPRENWQPRLEAADVLFFSGGVTPHLMFWLKKSGLAELLPELLKTRVYAGISAGSMVASASIVLSNKDKRLYYEERTGYGSDEGLGLVDVYVRPHLNSRFFPNANPEYIKGIAKNINAPVYALDDQCALKINDDVIEVVGGGEYLKMN